MEINRSVQLNLDLIFWRINSHMFKKTYLHLALSALLVTGGSVFAQTPSGEKTDSESAEVDIKKLSEAFGHFIGKNLKSSGLNFDVPSLIQGIQNGSEGKPSPLSEKEYEKGMLQLQEKAIKKLTEDNLKAANAYLEENKSKPNVVVLEPGKLQYKILTKGSGEEVKEHDTPMIKYKGQYIDGTVFGNSEDAGGTINLPLDQTIPGFSKAIVGMKEGEKRQIFVHPDLGYGTSGHLPPNSLLIFEVDVVKANAPQAEAADESDSEETPPIAELDVKIKQSPTQNSSANNKSRNLHEDDDLDEDEEDMDSDTYDDDIEYTDEDEDEPATKPVKK